MGALLPLIGKAAATTATTAVPASMAGTYFAGASGATAGLANALNAGITAGSALGGGGSLAALTPGIFAKAAPALGGLQSLTPTLATKAGPGLFNTMGMNPLAGGSKLAGQAGNISNQMYDQLVQQFGRQGAGNFPKIGEFAGNVTQLPGADMSKSLLGQGANFKAAPSATKTAGTITERLAPQVSQQAPGLVENIRNYKTLTEGAANMSYPLGKQGISANSAALQQAAASTVDPSKGFLSNAVSLAKNPSMQGAMDYIETHPVASAGAAYGLYNLLKPKPKEPQKDVSLIRPYDFSRTQNPEAYAVSPTDDSSERQYFAETFTPLEPYEAPGPEYKRAAEGGIMGLAVGGPVETMSAMNAIGGNMQYPQAGLHTALYSNPMMQRPESVNVISPGEGPAVGAYSGEQKFAAGGLSDLGGYSDGGRLLKGPGDGVSDSIPAVIGERQPARLADGEFVVPARIVSELGNGSTEAGARKLYAMMDRVQKARRKTVGKNRVATNTRAEKHLPA
jgi:hypothetical protein